MWARWLISQTSRQKNLTCGWSQVLPREMAQKSNLKEVVGADGEKTGLGVLSSGVPAGEWEVVLVPCAWATWGDFLFWCKNIVGISRKQARLRGHVSILGEKVWSGEALRVPGTVTERLRCLPWLAHNCIGGQKDSLLAVLQSSAGQGWPVSVFYGFCMSSSQLTCLSGDWLAYSSHQLGGSPQ
jgi:hypothetical protein